VFSKNCASDDIVRAGESVNEAKRCIACGQAAFRQVVEKVGSRTYFGVQALDIEDPSTSAGQMVNGYFVMTAYVCSRCGHVEFYSARVHK